MSQVRGGGEPWLLILLFVIYQVVSFPFALLEVAVSLVAGRMGRAKEKIQARNKIKSDKKAAKLEDRERQRLEEIRQAAELRLVQEQQSQVSRDNQKRRRNKYLLREIEVKAPTNRSVRTIKESIDVPPNPNHGFVQKPLWKEVQEDREAILLEREREQAQLARTSNLAVAVVEEEMPPGPLTLEDILSLEELILVNEFFISDNWQDTTMNGIRMSDVTLGLAAVALSRFDLIIKLMKDGDYEQDYSDKWVTPMGCAIISKNWDMIEFLLDNDDMAHTVDKFQNAPLLQATLTGSYHVDDMRRILKLFLPDSRTDFNCRNHVGLTLVHAMAWRGWVEIMDQLLPVDCETNEERMEVWFAVNSQMNNGVSPLHFAILRGRPAAAQLLVSRGASAEAEDNNGCTPLCWAIAALYERGLTLDQEGNVKILSPVCNVLLAALNNPYCPATITDYVMGRLRVVLNPYFDEEGFLDAFYHTGRPVFGFIARYVEDGISLLLDLRFFEKLAASGTEHINNPDFVVTICGILFDVLVYAENTQDDFKQVCRSFLDEGGADFCLHVMQSAHYHTLEYPDDFSNSRSSTSLYSSSASTSTASSAASEFLAGCYGVMAEGAEVIDEVERNMAVAALMPLIQVIDSAEMMPWFTTHFSEVKTIYAECEEIVGPPTPTVYACDLSPELVSRTRKKVIIFELMLRRSVWTRPQDVVLVYLRNTKLERRRASQAVRNSNREPTIAEEDEDEEDEDEEDEDEEDEKDEGEEDEKHEGEEDEKHEGEEDEVEEEENTSVEVPIVQQTRYEITYELTCLEDCFVVENQESDGTSEGYETCTSGSGNVSSVSVSSGGSTISKSARKKKARRERAKQERSFFMSLIDQDYQPSFTLADMGME